MKSGYHCIERVTWGNGFCTRESDTVAIELPVALVYNGISHVVTMVTPSDLEDMALGFSLTEGIVRNPQQLFDCELVQREQGLELSMRIAAEAFASLKQRRRNLSGRTGCGLCGVESLAQVMPSVPKVNRDWKISNQAIQKARESLDHLQSIKNCGGGVHAAAWCSYDGSIQLIREDVGRHNALDKLLGALHSTRHSAQGFVIVTSRASYEMVAKVASQNIPLLAALSAPTSMAIEMAAESGLTLVAHVKEGRQALYTHADRCF